MSSVSYFKRKDSPYFQLRFYFSRDMEPDPKKRRQSKSSKFPTTKAGEREVQSYVKQVNAAFVRKERLNLAGVDIAQNILLSEGTNLFLLSKPDLAKKTVEAYQLSADKMIKSCSDKYINRYTDSDYSKLITFLNKKNFSDSSKSIFTRHLSAMWNYFIKQKWADKNIIIKVKSSKTNAMPIPYKEMQKLLRYYEEKNKEQFYFVYFLLLTGIRPSSAIVQEWEQINLTEKYLSIKNVKAKKEFLFPIHSELENLLKEMGSHKKGKLFNYSDKPRFFNKDCAKLFSRGNLGHPYTLSQLRNTFPSWLANKGVNVSTIQKLLDHSDVRVTTKHYTTFELDYLRKEIEKANFKEIPRKKR